MSTLPRELVVWPIRCYQRFISPCLPPACRYVPTCSAYAAEAVLTHGVVRGLLLACRRLLRCHPWCAGGYDPVPPPRHSGRVAPGASATATARHATAQELSISHGK